MMKRIFFFTVLLFSAVILNAQEQPSESPAVQLSRHIADKMADTLGLTNQQKAKVFAINLELHKQKAEARKKSPDRAVVSRELQKIENGRDTLYQRALTPEQFTLYRQKKRYLVSRN